MTPDVDTRPVTPAELPVLADLFQSQRTTRHCWCTAFCSTRGQFAAGWFGGGNRRRFETMTATSPEPVGVLASSGGGAVGWAACGPRARYVAVTRAGGPSVRDRVPDEDGEVWLLPCLFVREGWRGRGVPGALVRAAVELARDQGAAAVEAWPLATGESRPAEAFVGRQEVFERAGFRSVGRPAPGRVLVRLDLSGT